MRSPAGDRRAAARRADSDVRDRSATRTPLAGNDRRGSRHTAADRAPGVGDQSDGDDGDYGGASAPTAGGRQGPQRSLRRRSPRRGRAVGESSLAGGEKPGGGGRER